VEPSRAAARRVAVPPEVSALEAARVAPELAAALAHAAAPAASAPASLPRRVQTEVGGHGDAVPLQPRRISTPRRRAGRTLHAGPARDRWPALPPEPRDPAGALAAALQVQARLERLAREQRGEL
jgi:hypothetical protein